MVCHSRQGRHALSLLTKSSSGFARRSLANGRTGATRLSVVVRPGGPKESRGCAREGMHLACLQSHPPVLFGSLFLQSALKAGQVVPPGMVNTKLSREK